MRLGRLLQVPHCLERLLLGQTSEESVSTWIYWRRHPLERIACSPVGLITVTIILAAAVTYNKVIYQSKDRYIEPQIQFELEHDSVTLQDAPQRDMEVAIEYGRLPDK